MKVFDAVVNRRTIRVFQEKPLDYAILEKCIEGARLAPTAMNSQLCEYFVADEKSLVAQILTPSLSGRCCKTGTGLLPKRAVAILLSLSIGTGKARLDGTPSRYRNGTETWRWWPLGLVSALIMTGIDKRIEIIKTPAKYEVAAMLALGYPDEKIVLESTSGSVKRWVDEQGVLHIPKRTLEDILHHNRFE